MMKRSILLALALIASACSSGLSGTYADSTGITRYTFSSNGTVTLTAMGVESEMDYVVEDGKVKIGSPQGRLIMTIMDDGSLEGPLGMKLTKQAE